MPKRGGLGQRGLDLLISASPGGTDKSAAEEKPASKEKSPAKKNSRAVQLRKAAERAAFRSRPNKQKQPRALQKQTIKMHY